MASYSDNFNRTTLGANWTAVNGGTWSILSSTRLQQTNGTGTYRGLRYTSPMDTANIDVSLVVRSGSAYDGSGILVGMPDSGTTTATLDGYAILKFDNDAFYLVRFDSGDDGGVGYGYSWGAVADNTDYTLRITVEGSTVTGYVDGVQRFTFTDTTYTRGSGNRSVAALSYGAVQFDDFAATDISSGISGTLTGTLGAVTSSSAGQVALQGSSTGTLGALTVSSTGALGAGPAQGTLTQTLAALQSAASGALGLAGSASPTLAPAVLSATASLAIQASATGTLTALTTQLPHSVRFYGNATDQIDRIRIPLEDGSSTQYPPNVGASSFTYDIWLRCSYANNTTTATDARYSNIVLDRDSWGEQRGHVVLGVTRNGSNLVACFGQAGSGGSWNTIRTTSNIGDNAWHHIAVTRSISTGQVQIWVDGISEASGTYDTTDWSYPAGHVVGIGQDNEYLVIGTEKHDVGFGYDGEIDELRISDVVRYSSGFTPVRRFESGSNTVGLYHVDAGTGTVLLDSATVSGSPTPGEFLVGGTPTGPVWVELPSAELIAGGNVTATLGALTVSSTSIVALKASLSGTLASLQVTASAIIPIRAISEATLAALTVGSSADLNLVASVVQTLAAATSTAAGAIALQAATSVVLGDATLASTATSEATGSVAGVLEELTVGSIAVLTIAAEVSSTLDPVAADSVGTLALVATSAGTLDALSMSAIGFVGNAPAIGQLVATLSDATLNAIGLLPLQANAVNLLESLEIVSQATLNLQGIASGQLEDAQIVAIGILTLQGDLAITLDSAIIQAAGSVGWNAITGAADITLADLASASAGQLAVVGGVTATLHSLELTAAGALAIRGTSTVTLENATLIADNLASAVVMIIATLYGPATSHGNLGISTESTLVGPGN